MKCPLCDNKMFQSDWADTPFYFCMATGKCAGTDGIYIGLIRAIRRKLKEAEAIGFNRGHSVAMQQIAGCKELNKEAKL